MGLKLLAEIGLDGSGFEAGLKRMESVSHGVADGLKSFAVQAIGIGTLEQAISKTVDTAKELVETSKRLSVAPEQLQLLRQAAKESGIELEDVAGFLEKIDVARQHALRNSSPKDAAARAAFGALGVTPAMLQSQTSAQLLMGPLANSANTRNAADIGVLFRDLGIRGFGPLIALLKTDFGELSTRMKNLGSIMDTETAVSLKSTADELDLLGQVITARLGPALIALAEACYKSALLVAAGGSFLGAATAKMTWKDILALGIPGLGLKAAGKIDISAGKAAAEDTGLNWLAALDKVKKHIEEEAEKLRHPKPPKFTDSVISDDEEKTFSTRLPASDSLTKVGNFLGGMGIADRVEQRKVELLQQIANNTAARTASQVPPPHPPSLSPTPWSHGDVHFPH